MMADGKMENKMEKVSIIVQPENQRKGSGKKEDVWNGYRSEK